MEINKQHLPNLYLCFHVLRFPLLFVILFFVFQELSVHGFSKSVNKWMLIFTKIICIEICPFVFLCVLKYFCNQSGGWGRYLVEFLEAQNMFQQILEYVRKAKLAILE